MKILALAAATLVTLSVGGCQKANEKPPIAAGGARGRYVGVGIYSPGQMWVQLVHSASPAPDPAAATLDDDEQIIVLLDSATGEFRQCGNLSGHCIGLNPWTKPQAKGQTLPAALLKHAQELQSEGQVEGIVSPR